MMLRRRVAVTGLLIALPVAAVLAILVDRARMHDMAVALDRVVRSQVNDQVRERCTSDPTWFLTGPLIGRPPNGVFVETSPDQLPPRAKPPNQPFELFAYDEQYAGSSPGSARFPPDFRRPLRASPDEAVTAPYVTDEGTGVQMALDTKWVGTPCHYFLGRMTPPAHQFRTRALTFLGFFAACAIVAFLTAVPTMMRVRKLAGVLRDAIAGGYTSIAAETRKDELSGVTFMYNDVVKEMQLRQARIGDLDEALRRFTDATEDEVAKPLAALETKLGEMAMQRGTSIEDVRDALRQAHDLGAEVENLAAASRLKGSGAIPARPVDLNAIVERVVARHRPLAAAGEISVDVSLASPAVIVQADEPLLERAIANVVDNAIRYNAPGGQVTISLTRAEGGSRFRLWVRDNGRGVTEEHFRTLTAVRRFRGDEGRNRRPGSVGLGLAVAQEVVDRSGLKLDLKRPGPGGFEVEFTGAA